MNPASRAFADRFQPLYHNAKPNFYHAGIYSAVTHYLNAAAAIGVDKAKASGKAVVDQMKLMPVNDPYYQGVVRADGKFVHDTRVWKTKTVAESKGPWDFFKELAVVPADKSFRPIGDSGCPLVKA